MKSSPLFTLQWKDAFKGIITAALTSVITAVIEIIGKGGLPTPSDWKTIGVTGLAAALGYIMKNYFTNSNDKFAKPEPK